MRKRHLRMNFWTKLNIYLYFLGTCLDCEPGTTCPDLMMNETLPCPIGFYCDYKTYDNGTACPIGKYNNSMISLSKLYI